MSTSPGESELLLRRRHDGQRVLLVEDNPVNREVAEELLSGTGLVVETAVDGERAVEMASTRRYDLVLMDMQMPGIDGIEATRILRRRLGQALPIVAMTANAFGDDRAACIEAGMNDHIAKPVDPEMLYATLLRWLPVRALAPAATVQGSPPPEPVPFEQRAASIEGLDFALALAHVGGRPQTLERVLRRFVQTYRGGDDNLAELPAQHAVERWRGACHSLRGACSTIGAVELQGEVMAFKRSLAQTSDELVLATQAAALQNSLLQFVGRIATLIEA